LQEDWQTLFLHLTMLEQLLGQMEQMWVQQVLVLVLILVLALVLLLLLVQKEQLEQQVNHL
jgi:hypothetical protein